MSSEPTHASLVSVNRLLFKMHPNLCELCTHGSKVMATLFILLLLVTPCWYLLEGTIISVHLKITKNTVHDCAISKSKVCSDLNAIFGTEHVFHCVTPPTGYAPCLLAMVQERRRR